MLIFGYLGYLLARGILERRFWPIVGSVATFFLYGGALFGVLPGQMGIVAGAPLRPDRRHPRGPVDAEARRPGGAAGPSRARIAARSPARVEPLPGADDTAAEAEIEAELERSARS